MSWRERFEVGGAELRSRGQGGELGGGRRRLDLEAMAEAAGVLDDDDGAGDHVVR